MSDPIYGRWFDAKEVPVTMDADAWIVTANNHAGRYTAVCAFHASALRFETEATPPFDAWMRIQPPPWLDAKEDAEPCGHSADHCKHWHDWPMAEGQEEPYGDPGDGLGVQGVCCECGKSRWPNA